MYAARRFRLVSVIAILMLSGVGLARAADEIAPATDPAPAPAPDPAPTLDRLVVSPALYTVNAGSAYVLTVTAVYSDGSRVDVTLDATYAVRAGATATGLTVADDGWVDAGSVAGQAVIDVSYGGLTRAAGAVVIAP